MRFGTLQRRLTGRALLSAAAVGLAALALAPRHAVQLPELLVPPRLDELDAIVQQEYAELRGALHESRAGGKQFAIAEAYGRLGMWHLNYGFDDTAELCFRTAAELQPRSSAWPFYLARSLATRGRAEEAVAAFERVLAIDPKDVTALVLLAETELDRGRSLEARLHLERALTLDPASVRAQVRLGQIAHTEGRLTRAQLLLEEASTRLPNHPEVRHSLGLVYRDQGRVERARPLLARAAQDSDHMPALPLPDRRTARLVSRRSDSLTLSQDGARALRAGRYAQAAAAYREAVAIAPDEAAHRINLALALHGMGRDGEAEAELEEAARRSPSTAGVHYALGELQRDPEKAELHLREALRLAPGHADAQTRLAQVLRQQRRFGEAASHLEAALERDPARAERWLLLTMLLVEAGRERDALSAAERAADMLPDRPEATMLAARLLATAGAGVGDPRRALTLARTMFARHPTLAAAETVAMALAATGDFPKAAGIQEAALREVRQAGREQELPWVGRRLELYRAHRAPVEAWAPGEPGARTAGLEVKVPEKPIAP